MKAGTPPKKTRGVGEVGAGDGDQGAAGGGAGGGARLVTAGAEAAV